MNNETEFTDKSGKPIRIGDILQVRLGKFAKRGGPIRVRVIRYGKRVQIVDLNNMEYKYGGSDLTDQTAKNSVIIDRAD